MIVADLNGKERNRESEREREKRGRIQKIVWT